MEDGFEEKWVEVGVADGKAFFYHLRTREITLNRPEGPNVKIIPCEQLQTGLWVEGATANGKVYFWRRVDARAKKTVSCNRPEGKFVKIITGEQVKNLKKEIQIWKSERSLEKKLIKEIQGAVGQRAMEVVEPTKVRQAILNELKRKGQGFTVAKALINAALEISDPRVQTSSPVPSSSREEPSSLVKFYKKWGNHFRELIEKEVEEALESYKNAAIVELYTCKKCLDDRIEVMFLPCGHVACCSSCASPLRNCPLCTKAIDVKQKVFLP